MTGHYRSLSPHPSRVQRPMRRFWRRRGVTISRDEYVRLRSAERLAETLAAMLRDVLHGKG